MVTCVRKQQLAKTKQSLISQPLLFSIYPPRDFLKQFTTMELMRWSSLVEDYGKELREGSPDSPATDVFTYNEEGEKRWQDLKNRVVEHVSCSKNEHACTVLFAL